MLEFGTAGLRGALGAGPNRMNRSVVIRAAAGLTAYLQASKPEPFVVVGFDARYNSDVFARDTAAVVVGAGGRAAILPSPLPTPVLAYAIRYLGADAGVMVTASHNPPEDNGYKVYLGDGSQIVPPSDAGIATQIARVAAVADVPLADDGWETLGDDVLDGLPRRRRHASSRRTPRATSPSCTPRCTASGSETVRQGLRPCRVCRADPRRRARPSPTRRSRRCTSPTPRSRARWTRPSSWPSRPGPTSSSPTTPTPTGAPSRCPAPAAWRMLRGDEVGALLGAHILARGVATAMRSSPTRSCRRDCSRRWPRPPACGTRRR